MPGRHGGARAWCPAAADRQVCSHPPAQPAGSWGPWGVPAEPEPAKSVRKGRKAARWVLTRSRGGDLLGGRGFVVTVLPLMMQREMRSSGHVLTWPEAPGGLSLLSAAPWECVQLLHLLSVALGSGAACSLGFLDEAASCKRHVFLCGLCPRGSGCAWGSGSAIGVTVGRMVSGSVGWLPASQLPAGSGCSILAAPGIVCFSMSSLGPPSPLLAPMLECVQLLCPQYGSRPWHS